MSTKVLYTVTEPC